ncbi:MAG: isoprenylcysteine carboxylmethyltransferase family protein [Ignavibacteriaceae bacterium]
MGLGDIFLIVCFCWVASETLLLVLRRSKTGSQDKDSGFLKWLNIVIYTSVFGGVFIAYTRYGHIENYPYFLRIAGLVFILLGLAIRWISILTLHRFFTVDVSIQADHKIIQSGIYKYLRHPSYTGMLLSFFGLGISLNNWISFCVILFPILYILLKRIKIEEQVLNSSFGNDYLIYSNNTWRLIPWIY